LSQDGARNGRPSGMKQLRKYGPKETPDGAVVLAGLFLALSGGLWATASGTYFVKPMTESHNIVLAAYNVRDFLSFVLQDMAPSPDPAAHPYWYIHHPNLFAKAISFFWLQVGVGLEGQTGILLLAVATSLCALASAVGRVSRWGGIAAVAVALTSYGSFHFSAGDLCRGPLYLLLFPTVLALVKNPQLNRTGHNVLIAGCVVLSILSDWGFAVFIVAFVCGVATYGRGYVPWRWALTWVVIPAFVALCAYEAVVIYAVGWDFFLLDTKVTYLGRIGAGTVTSPQGLLDIYRDNRVVIWPPHNSRETNLFDTLAVLASAPILNSGPAWLVLGPFCALMVVRSLARLKLPMWARVVVGVSLALSATRVVPMIVILPALVVIGFALKDARMTTKVDKLTGLTIAALFGTLVAVAIFPAFTLSFSIAGGRPPMPLLEMLVAATFAELAMTGAASRYLRQGVGEKLRVSRSSSQRLVGPALATVMLAGVVYAIISADGMFYGIPKSIALGALALMLGASLALPVINALGRSSSAAQTTSPRRYPYVILGLLLVSVAAALSTHVSSDPAVLGRYSYFYAVVMLAILSAAGISFVLSIGPGIRTFGGDLLLSRALRWMDAGSTDRGALGRRAGQLLAVGLVSVQTIWLLLSIVSRLPGPIPYAHVLQTEPYKGRTFLTTGYDALVWYSTKAWAYMPEKNPPDLQSISLRYRHFADWANARKYGRPVYFLCDNTGFAYIRVSPALNGKDASCGERCTCHDVAKWLERNGNSIEIDRPDYAIIKLHWPQD